tara:strand:+ start:1594 stop:3312 length:1719 start_codon:yes stop_codon:yes gene_type:complete
MAEQIVSPGVFTRENDQSFITQQPVELGAAIVGPTVKGPVEIPTIVTSYSQYENIFGTTFVSASQTYSFLTSISAFNYFQNGGVSLVVTRVVSGGSAAFTSATSANITGGSGVTNAFALKTISEGAIMNTGTLDDSGSLSLGTTDNVRFEITTSNTSAGTFTLNIRRGDDNNNEKVILETFANVSLDPEQDNYIAKAIGDTYYQINSDDANNKYVQTIGEYPNVSKYVYVSAVNNPTPNFFDNNGVAKSEFTASVPLIQSGGFSGGTGETSGSAPALFFDKIDTNTQGLVGSDYDTAFDLLKNKDEYQYNLITAPGLLHDKHTNQVNTLIQNTQDRGDAIAVVDLEPYGALISATTNQASGINSSYAAAYWPWCQIINPNTGKINWVPASALIPGVYAFNDSNAEPWFAPAGINRGGLTQVIRPERKLQRADRDTLYEANVNPIANFPANGTVVFGQKTLQKKASALDRVNVRRLLIALKGFIGQVANNLVFEQNTAATRNSFLAQVNPYLESVQQRQGVFAFKVVMDDSNNTPDVIDRNQLVGQIFIQPTRTAEFIVLDFNVLPTGAEFPA